MSTSRPIEVKFTNLITIEDMKSALSLIPKSARTAIFVDGSENAEELEPEVITYFFTHNQCIQHVTFFGISSSHATALATALMSDKRISSLCLPENELTGENLAVLYETALKANTTLRTLDISYGEDLDGKAVTVLRHTHLTALHTASNELNGNHVASLLNTNPQLLTLNASENALWDTDNDGNDSDLTSNSDDDEQDDIADNNKPSAVVAADAKDYKPAHPLAALTKAIQDHRCLREINLANCRLKLPIMNDKNDVDQLTELYTALFTHPTLTHVNISCNTLSDETLRLVAFLTIRGNQLTHLDMTRCMISPRKQMHEDEPDDPQTYMYTLDSIRMLVCSPLTHLILTLNHLNDDDLAILRPQLRNNKTLVELYLAQNEITASGVQHLLPFLERTKTLQVLDLSDNRIELTGLIAIFDALQRNKNCAVHTLVLEECYIEIPKEFGEKDRNDFISKIPRSLLHLDLNTNSIANDAKLMQRVEQKLRFNQTILRYTQRLSPLVAFVRAHAATTHLQRGILPVIPEITGYLTADGAIEIDIREHQKKSANAGADPAVKPAN